MVLGLVKLQPVRGAAKGVGQDQLRARIDKGGMQRAYLVGAFHIPQFRRVARLEALLEEIGSGGAVSKNPACLI